MFGAIVCLCLLATTQSFQLYKERPSSIQTPRVDASVPVRLTYIDRFSQWWPPSAIAQGLAVPGYTSGTLPFNYILLAFWTYASGPVDAALVWSNPLYYIGAGVFGDTKEEIQATLKQKYTDAGVKLMVSAFGATENPTSSNYDAIQCATKLAQFVTDNLLDGVDIDWEDTPAFLKADGSGEDWLITLTTELRKLLPDKIITHAPQAPYFCNNDTATAQYPKGAYRAVHAAVGDQIDFYNIQFYNQGTTMYENAQDLFNISSGWAPGTSINEIIAFGVPSNKVILGKPAGVGDANNGYMTAATIDAAIATNYPYNGWKAGVMFWQYSSDSTGSICTEATKSLMSFAAQAQEEKKHHHKL